MSRLRADIVTNRAADGAFLASEGINVNKNITFSGATSNRIDFNTNGAGAPTTTTRSEGTKIVLFPSVNSTKVDVGFGVDNTLSLWSSVGGIGNQFKWYAGTTNIATLFGTGELVLGTTAKTGTASQPLQVTGGAYISGNLGIGVTNPSQAFEVLGRVSLGGTGVQDALYIRRVSDNTTGVTFGYNSTTVNNELKLAHNSGSGIFTIHLNGTGGELGNGFNEKFRFTSEARLGIGTTNPTNVLDINSDSIRLRTSRTPASATATGTQGEICWDASYIYVCTATNTWRRASLLSW